MDHIAQFNGGPRVAFGDVGKLTFQVPHCLGQPLDPHEEALSA